MKLVNNGVSRLKNTQNGLVARLFIDWNRIYGIRILSQIAAAMLMTIVAVGMFVLFNFKLPFLEWTLSISDSKPWYEKISWLLMVCIVSIYTAAITMRVMARAFPLRSDNQRRWCVIGLLLLLTMVLVLPSIFVLWPDPETDIVVKQYMESERTDVSQFDGLNVNDAVVGIHIMSEALAYSLLIQVFIGLVFPILWTVIRLVKRVRVDGVLFLRRFGTSGDAAIKPSLLRHMPNGHQLAFISTPGQHSFSWNPVQLVFAGFNPLRPWADVPVYLKTSDQMWERDVKSCIEQSRVVVFDVSQDSDSIKVEKSLIETARAGDRTVALMNMLSSTTSHSLTSDGCQVVKYRLSWLASVPSVVLISLLSMIAGFFDFELDRSIFRCGCRASVMGASCTRSAVERRTWTSVKHETQCN